MVAGEMHSMEVQLWHWNVEHASFEQASAMHDGLATISIPFGEGDSENIPLSTMWKRA